MCSLAIELPRDAVFAHVSTMQHTAPETTGIFINHSPSVQRGPLKLRKRPPLPPWVLYHERAHEAWIHTPWTNSGTVYELADRHIAADAANRRVDSTYVSELESAALRDPKNPVAQFRWADALLFEITTGKTTDQAAFDELEHVQYCMDRTVQPGAYEDARVRYLISAHLFHALSPPEYIYMGEKLLHKNPNDLEVKYPFVLGLEMSYKPKWQAEAFPLAQDLVRKNPASGRAYYTLAMWYWAQTYTNKRQADFDAAITNLQLAREHYPAGSSENVRMGFAIEFLKDHFHYIKLN